MSKEEKEGLRRRPEERGERRYLEEGAEKGPAGWLDVLFVHGIRGVDQEDESSDLRAVWS